MLAGLLYAGANIYLRFNSNYVTPLWGAIIASILLFAVLFAVYRVGQHRTTLESQYFTHSSFLSLLETQKTRRNATLICTQCQENLLRNRGEWWQQLLELLYGSEPK